MIVTFVPSEKLVRDFSDEETDDDSTDALAIMGRMNFSAPTPYRHRYFYPPAASKRRIHQPVLAPVLQFHERLLY
jgi:hypothetical protein